MFSPEKAVVQLLSKRFFFVIRFLHTVFWLFVINLLLIAQIWQLSCKHQPQICQIGYSTGGRQLVHCPESRRFHCRNTQLSSTRLVCSCCHHRLYKIRFTIMFYSIVIAEINSIIYYLTLCIYCLWLPQAYLSLLCFENQVLAAVCRQQALFHKGPGREI